MPEPIQLTTDRLLLRPWRDSDREPFAALNADPAVMEFFPAMLSHAESDAMADRIQAGFDERGWGLWAVEVVNPTSVHDAIQTERTPFIGYVGLAIPRFDAHFTPCVEIGWRLQKSAWGFGYAPEAARAVLQFGFEQLKLAEIVSLTATVNLKSQRVMQKLNMSYDAADDFDHPALSEGHRLRRHVLYRLSREFFIDTPTPV
ncbi:GNAT family N-acetyltransferase [Schlesneria paludicola]|uniref:GNAT family N-acetyltransferase n=1 Tax=Schlesneria paludicola TaxID=360056 RepID=UPI00029B32B4|nr:GNAT family N-acetyltransferase [Schlesneria paludicola]